MALASKLMRTILLRDWTLSDVQNGWFVGPGTDISGAISGNPQSVGLFDLTPFRGVYAFLEVEGYSGTSPVIQVQALGYHQPTHPGNFRNVQGCLANTAAGSASAADTGCSLFLGSCGVGAPIISAGVAFVNNMPFTYSYQQLFTQFQVGVKSGTLSALSKATLAVYGMEW